MPIISGGGGSGTTPALVAISGDVLPVAATAGVTVDTTTYDNTVTGVGKLTTLVFPAADTVALAIAKAGDAFPRWLMISNASNAQGMYMSDGTFDPFAQFGSIYVGEVAGRAVLFTNTSFTVGSNSATVGPAIGGGPNAPGIGGQVGDLWIRTNPTSDADYLYRCTGAGVAGVATWAPITGA